MKITKKILTTSNMSDIDMFISKGYKVEYISRCLGLSQSLIKEYLGGAMVFGVKKEKYYNTEDEALKVAKMDFGYNYSNLSQVEKNIYDGVQ